MADIIRRGHDKLGYHGEVEIGLVRKNKKYKLFTTNNGTVALFEYICKCLAAQLTPEMTVNTGDRPMRLNLEKSDGSVLGYNLPFTDIKIVKTGNNDDTNGDCSIIFNFLIPGTSIAGITITGVQLVNIANTIVYAKASLGDKSISIDDVDSNVYVSWKLTIKNEGA